MAEETIVTATGTDAGAAGADTGLDFDIGTDTGADAGADAGTDVSTVDATKVEHVEQPVQQAQEEPDVKDFAGHVSGRIRNLVKMSPDFGKALAANPKLRDAIEAPLRREAAYRDIFPTVAEAKAMRETFPNGLQDVAALKEDLAEVEEIDKLTYNRDQDGNYSGHGKLIENIFSSDRNAAISLFKNVPREWHRLDPGSYNETMGRIVGATLTANGEGGAWAQLIEAREAAAAAGDSGKGLVAMLDKVLNRLSPFVEERKPDPGQEALNRDRQQFDRQRQQSEQQTQQQFASTFVGESKKLQNEIIGGHKVMQKLATVKSITPQKRAEITEKVRVKMEQFLKNSPSFMRPVSRAYEARDLNETLKVQRAAWSQEWLLNRMIRDVLKVETPELLNNNRATLQRRTGTAPGQKPASVQSRDGKPTAPFKDAGQWYHANGRRMTTQEAIRHEMSLN